MFHRRHSVAVVVFMMVFLLAQSPSTAALGPAQGEGQTSDGAPVKKRAFKANFALIGVKAPPAQSNGEASIANKKIPPAALSQVPAEWVLHVSRVPVPNFSGKSLTQVRQEAIAPGGKPLFAAIYPDEPADGVVVENGQSPRAGTMVVPGTQRLILRLRIPSKPEPQQTVVPPVKGLNTQAAALKISQARLRPNFSGAVKDGLAGDPSPAAGTVVNIETPVSVVFALPQVVVPPLKGLRFDDAKQRLADSSLQLGQVDGLNTSDATVELQSPEALTLVDPNSSVEVTMAPPAPVQVSVPRITNKSCDEARALIAAANLRPAWTECPSARALVARQTPLADTMVDPQTVVSALYAPVSVPPLLGLSSEAAEDQLKVAGLEALISAPRDWDPAKAVVGNQFPKEGTQVEIGSGVSMVMTMPSPWWQMMPWWGWVASGIALGGLSALIYYLIHKPPSNRPPAQLATLTPPVLTLQPRISEGKVDLRGKAGPKVRLSVALRDHTGEPKITTTIEPAITKREVH